nr:MAG TPA: hypothetical protein [Caudoviricetes sp.]
MNSSRVIKLSNIIVPKISEIDIILLNQPKGALK